MAEQNESIVSASSEIQSALSGTQTIEEILNEAILQEAERRNIGKKKKTPADQIDEEAKLHLKRFYDSTVELAKKVREEVNQKYPAAHILEFRTSLLPFSEGLNLLLVFDTIDLETEMHIGFVLSEIEKEFFVKRKTFCEITSMRKTKYLGSATVNKEYPFVVKV